MGRNYEGEFSKCFENPKTDECMEVLVEYSINPGSKRTWDYPGDDPCVEEMRLSCDGKNVYLDDLIEYTGKQKLLEEIEDACFEHAYEDARDRYEAAQERRWEQETGR